MEKRDAKSNPIADDESTSHDEIAQKAVTPSLFAPPGANPEDNPTHITVSLKNAPLGVALAYVTNQTNMQFRTSNGVVSPDGRRIIARVAEEQFGFVDTMQKAMSGKRVDR